MSKTTLHIKNMVCPRCITAVNQTLNKLNIKYTNVKLGEAIVEDNNLDTTILDKELKAIGFELITDKNSTITEQIKAIIIDTIHHSKKELNFNFSNLIKEKTDLDYSYVSKIFSEIEGIIPI